MKSGKKIELKPKNGNFKVISGAVINYKKPRSVYVKMTAWLSFKDKIDNINGILKEYRLGLRRYLKASPVIHEHFNYNTIVDVNISESRVRLNKTTFFELDITFYQKSEENSLPLVKPKNENVPELRPILQQITNEILGLDLFDDSKYFNYHLLKKDAKMNFEEVA